MYVSAWSLENATALRGVSVRLRAFRNGKALSGGAAILPIASPVSVKKADVACVTTADRENDENVFTFLPPASWLTGMVSYRAEIQPLVPPIDEVVRIECATTFCRSLKQLTLTRLGFNRISSPVTVPLRILADGAAPGAAGTELYDARALHPGDQQITPYLADIDISDLVAKAKTKDADPDLAKLSARTIVEGGAYQRVQDWTTNARYRKTIVVGIAPNVANLAGVDYRSVGDLPATKDGLVPVMVATNTRPLTSIAHEFGHALGRAHAGQACPGTGPNDDQAGELWLPDDQGYLQGIGLDLWAIQKNSRVYTATPQSPYRLLYPGQPGGPLQFYDLMSYCAATMEVASATNAPNAWLSPRGRNTEISALTAWSQRAGQPIGIASRRAVIAPRSVLRVSAVGAPDATAILSVTPTVGAPTPVVAAGPVLVGYDASGRELTRAGVEDQRLGDGGPHSYVGSLPSNPSIARVVIIGGGGVPMAGRTRSAHAPRVSVIRPTAGARIGGSAPARISWRASDADGDRLVSIVDTSADDGRSWRRVYEGPARSVRLSGGYFAGSKKARIRVTVSDGFLSRSVVSHRFVALRPPAVVTIDTPRTGSSIASDGSLLLPARR